MINAKLYEAAGVSAGQLEDGREVVGLILPKENPIDQNDHDEIYFPLPVIKALLIDLQEAIDVAVKHKSGSRNGEDDGC